MSNDKPAGVLCDCGSRNTFATGCGGYQEADASRGMPEIEAELVACDDCGRAFWY